MNLEAKRLSSVTELPNAHNISSYSGFLTVNKKLNNNLFFWFFPALNNDKTAPVILWLQGGPGCSSMLGLFTEMGPFKLDDKLNLVANKYSWSQNYSVLYIDSPVGTGFSYTTDAMGFATNEQNVAEDLYNALQQFFKLFAEYKNNEFYVTGESYAGKYVPAIGFKLHQMSATSGINFKGISIGNGWIDPLSMLDVGSYLYQTGLIDKTQLNHFYDIQNKTAVDIKQNKYREAFDLFDQLLGGDVTSESYFTKVTGFHYYLNILQSNEPKGADDFAKFLNLNTTQEAIHVGCTAYSSTNTTVFTSLTEDEFSSVKPWFTTLIDNYKVLIYSGQLDIIVATTLTENFLQSLEWKHSKEYSKANRLVWKLDKGDTEVTGYVKRVANFTEVIVRNAGHMVPTDQPRAALSMIDNFIRDLPFE
ncbi:unnamed protein product [Medioppia subpectinata]|uniref:Carboxypeptidase n=1 Tax=Medioppia subpectinata TaxID=1979941 RepID=A0A7R9Q5E4_9ACAR|nr:unnamed protein product [Medioppia subpectinata]CAG2112243.1 unnamed protein product [Medioppia subpectinata]